MVCRNCKAPVDDLSPEALDRLDACNRVLFTRRIPRLMPAEVSYCDECMRKHRALLYANDREATRVVAAKPRLDPAVARAMRDVDED